MQWHWMVLRIFCHIAIKRTHTPTHMHTRTKAIQNYTYDSVYRSHSSLIYWCQNNSTTESLSHYSVCVCTSVRVYVYSMQATDFCQSQSYRLRCVRRVLQLKSKLNGKHKYELSSLILILKRIDEQIQRETMLKALFCSHFEWLAHTRSQWRMVDSTCVYFWWLFSSLRFVSFRMFGDMIPIERNVGWAVLRIIHFIMWMDVSVSLMLHATMSKCTMYNVQLRLLCNAQACHSNIEHLVYFIFPMVCDVVWMHNEKCYDISRCSWIVGK